MENLPNSTLNNLRRARTILDILINLNYFVVLELLEFLNLKLYTQSVNLKIAVLELSSQKFISVCAREAALPGKAHNVKNDVVLLGKL